MPRALRGTDREKCGSTSLELHPEKTRLEFRPFAAGNWKKREEDGKPDTFNFLGFTHICGKKKCNGRGTDLFLLPFGPSSKQQGAVTLPFGTLAAAMMLLFGGFSRQIWCPTLLSDSVFCSLERQPS